MSGGSLAAEYRKEARDPEYIRLLEKVEAAFVGYCEALGEPTVGNIPVLLRYCAEELKSDPHKIYLAFAMGKRLYARNGLRPPSRDLEVRAYRLGVRRRERHQYSAALPYVDVDAFLRLIPRGGRFRLFRIGAVAALVRWGGATSAHLRQVLREHVFREARGYRILTGDPKVPEILVGGRLPVGLIDAYLQERGDAPGPLLCNAMLKLNCPVKPITVTKSIKPMLREHGLQVLKMGQFAPMMRKLSESQYAEFLSAALTSRDRRRLRAGFVMVLARTGASLQELVRLDQADVDVSSPDVVRIRFREGRYVVEIAAVDEIGQKVLRRYVALRGPQPGYLFTLEDYFQLLPLRGGVFREDLHLAQQLAKISTKAGHALTPRSLRHSFVRDVLQLYGVARGQRLLGLVSPSWTRGCGVEPPKDPRDNEFRRAQRLAKTRRFRNEEPIP
jgi:hypothetical protein